MLIFGIINKIPLLFMLFQMIFYGKNFSNIIFTIQKILMKNEDLNLLGKLHNCCIWVSIRVSIRMYFN